LGIVGAGLAPLYYPREKVRGGYGKHDHEEAIMESSDQIVVGAVVVVHEHFEPQEQPVVLTEALRYRKLDAQQHDCSSGKRRRGQTTVAGTYEHRNECVCNRKSKN